MLEQQRPSTSLVGWETLEAFLKFPVPRPGIELGTSGMVDQSVTTRPPHHLSVFVNQGLCYNDDDDDDDDDEFEEAGFEPSSSKNAEKDSSTGTSCFKNRLESASLRDTAAVRSLSLLATAYPSSEVLIDVGHDVHLWLSAYSLGYFIRTPLPRHWQAFDSIVVQKQEHLCRRELLLLQFIWWTAETKRPWNHSSNIDEDCSMSVFTL
ncbi:hypothetical protein DPMN_062358 [Dreissena polymorpha]|uniref:Uncharacterized protein n=1 Tax=Dreissena polymorpha TaxID=45954 RepID=A0A9D4C9I0_DREPO|nr:hypothetical protein DPMN_062358 [Dreissena polymorpha]